MAPLPLVTHCTEGADLKREWWQGCHCPFIHQYRILRSGGPKCGLADSKSGG